MSTRHIDSTEISERQRNHLVAWEMEYDHPLELDDDLREAYETFYDDGWRKRAGSGRR